MPNSLNIEAGSRTDKGLKAYSDFIDVYVFGRNAEDALNAIQNIPKEIEDAFLKQRTDVKIDEWDDLVVRQLIECIKVMSKDTLHIYFKDGMKMEAHI